MTSIDPNVDKAVDMTQAPIDSLCRKTLELIDDMSVCKNSEAKGAVKKLLVHSIADIQRFHNECVNTLRNMLLHQKSKVEEDIKAQKPFMYDAMVFNIQHEDGGRAIKSINAEYLFHHNANDDVQEDSSRVVFPFRGYDSQKRIIFDYTNGNSKFFEMLGHWCHPMTLARGTTDSEKADETGPVMDPIVYGERVDDQLTDSEIQMYLYGKSPDEMHSQSSSLSVDVDLASVEANVEADQTAQISGYPGHVSLDDCPKTVAKLKKPRASKKKKGAKKQ